MSYNPFPFLAGFFRESGATESSTRLVGIVACFTACFLAIYIVVHRITDATAQVVVAQCIAFGCIALGLRSSPETETEQKTTTIPPASSAEPAVIETTTERGPA